MKTHSIATTLGLVLALAAVASAQDRNVIRQLGPITARAAEPVNPIGIRPLPSGVLVNDAPNRRLVLFDDQLSTFTVVADSTSATGNAYSGRLGGLLPYKGDSSLFTDPASLSMLVIDPGGKVARVMSMPGARDAGLLAGAMGGAAYDRKGGLVYRGTSRAQFRRVPGATAGNFGLPEIPDSAPILRIDLATRRLDTLGFIKTPKVKMERSTDEDGRVTIRSRLNPLPVVDDWAALPDGSIAFIRGRDYHVDWIDPDGSRISSAKIPFDWQRLTDDDKVAFLDSLTAARERMGEGSPGIAAVGSALGVSDAALDAAGPTVQILTPLGTPVGPGGGARQGARQDARQGARQAEAAASGQRVNANVNFVDPSELPDYKPAFFAGSVRVDQRGNLWIRTIPTKPITGGPVYDVIDRQGVLVERVQIPKGRTIVGFGPGDVVYLSVREERVSYLEKATIR